MDEAKEIETEVFEKVLVKLDCSPRELELGMQSPFWRNMRMQIEAWLEDIRDHLEDPDNLYLERTLRRLGGNAAALRYVLRLPDETLRNLRDGLTDV